MQVTGVLFSPGFPLLSDDFSHAFCGANVETVQDRV